MQALLSMSVSDQEDYKTAMAYFCPVLIVINVPFDIFVCSGVSADITLVSSFQTSNPGRVHSIKKVSNHNS